MPDDVIIGKECSEDDKKMEYLFVWRKGHPLPTIETTFIDYVKEMVSG